MQGEARNKLEKGGHFYFESNAKLKIGDEITPTNYGTTMRTNAVILENRNKLYHAVILTNEPIENRLDLTHLL